VVGYLFAIWIINPNIASCGHTISFLFENVQTKKDEKQKLIIIKEKGGFLNYFSNSRSFCR